MKRLRTPPLMAAAAVVLSLVLGGCGGSGKAPESEPPPEPVPEPMPVAASGDVTLSKAQHDALLAVLPKNGDSATLDDVGVGDDGVTRAGVTFTCVSDYACAVTVSNSAGTIVATWDSQTLGDGTVSVMATGYEPPPDPLAELNDASGAAVATIILSAGGVHGNTATTIGGLGLDGHGAMNIEGVTLTSNLNPNVATAHRHGSATGGSKMMAINEDGTYADYDPDAPNDVVALTGWSHKVLFRNWGDTVDDAQGGYETGVLLYSDVGAPKKDVPFDRKLHDMFVNTTAQGWFDFTVRLDGTTASLASLNDAVSITVNGTATDQTKNMMLTVATPRTETLTHTVGRNRQHEGTYFGVPGTYRCIGQGQDGGCGIERAEGGARPFGVALAADGEDEITWVFKPDPGQTIDVPDQDWVVYGAWLTTPKASVGIHRTGVFYDGMEKYANASATDVFDATDPNGLRGKATYKGGAAGVYVDGAESGMFTARARLTAAFDADIDGEDDDATDYMLSGRIYNFKRTNGTYLGTDPDDPPATGGGNNWVVLLGSDDLDTAEATSGIVGGTVSGSADGVSWATGGTWAGQLYGPGNTIVVDAVAPTGIAGQFRAITDKFGTATAPKYKGVVGAFGATKDP